MESKINRGSIQGFQALQNHAVMKSYVIRTRTSHILGQSRGTEQPKSISTQ